MKKSSSVDQKRPTPANGTTVTRRQFFLRSAGGASLLLSGGAACSSSVAEVASGLEPSGLALPPGKSPEAVTIHVGNPLVLETKREAFGSGGITPYEMLFVRNNLPTPPATILSNRDGWELTVEGVANPRSLRLGDLKSLDRVSVATVLQCSGNGRAFFEHEASGSQWTVGAAGCVIWTGVPVRVVADALGGVLPSARFLTGTGGEPLAEGSDPLRLMVERSIPVAKGMQDALLAWEMNGAPLSLAHGGPLRLIVPGYYGVNQVKYLKQLAFTDAESEAAIMRTSYRMRPVGSEATPNWPSLWEMNVKSWINRPLGGAPVRAGRTVIEGVAFAGGQPVRQVEVSLDGGQTWRSAPLVGPDLGRFAWRHFALPLELQVGTYTIASRATDAAGNVQPPDREENERGYANNSWRDHSVELTVI